MSPIDTKAVLCLKAVQFNIELSLIRSVRHNTCNSIHQKSLTFFCSNCYGHNYHNDYLFSKESGRTGTHYSRKKKDLNINFLSLLVTVGSALATAVFLCCHFRGFCVLFVFHLVLVTHWIINLFAQLCSTKSQHEDETLTLGCLQEVPTIIIVHCL